MSTGSSLARLTVYFISKVVPCDDSCTLIDSPPKEKTNKQLKNIKMLHLHVLNYLQAHLSFCSCQLIIDYVEFSYFYVCLLFMMCFTLPFVVGSPVIKLILRQQRNYNLRNREHSLFDLTPLPLDSSSLGNHTEMS